MLLLVASGCAELERLFTPSPPPPPPRPAPAPPVQPSPTPPRPTPVPPPPVRPVPPPPAPKPEVPPPPAPAPPKPEVPPPPAPAPPKPESPPPVLAPQVGEGEAPRLRQEVESRIQRTEGMLARVEQPKLGKAQRDTLATIQNFLVMAKEALAAQDLPRAATLANKAEVLAEDLVKTPH